jgi:hypothetical protein
MRRAVTAAILALATTAACAAGADRACLVWPDDARPLAVGDSISLRVGTLVGSDCDAARPRPAVWRALDPAVATVSPGGAARGIAPGLFRAVAVAGVDTLAAEGYVLPRGWRARLSPESATVRVGDTVAFRVTAVDSAGRALPPVPFSLYTPEFLATERAVATGAPGPARAPGPLTDRWSHQGITGPGVFRAERPGTTSITGELDTVRIAARLTILPRATSP